MKFSEHATCRSGLILLQRQCSILRICAFVNDIMFSHNWTTTDTGFEFSKLFSTTLQMAPLNCAPGGQVCHHWLSCFIRNHRSIKLTWKSVFSHGNEPRQERQELNKQVAKTEPQIRNETCPRWRHQQTYLSTQQCNMSVRPPSQK